MSEPIAKHQLFEYTESTPFHFYVVNGNGDMGTLLNHWHEELEMAYCIKGNTRHYINGECVQGGPGRLVVTNSGFMHNIIPDEKFVGCEEMTAVVVIVEPRFLNACFPEYQNIYFLNRDEVASREIQDLMQKIIDYALVEHHQEYDELYGKSLVLSLLYEMCKSGTAKRELVDDINVLKNIERMKGVVQFIENYYAEPISQKMVAEKFYFSQVYFSRYFKKCMGMTFTEYLNCFRLEKARKELIYTKKSVSQIALDNGFSDDRRLIISFKKKHGITPLQYRKKNIG